MQYDIKFHSINEPKLTFESDIIGNGEIDAKTFELLYNDYTIKLDKLDEFKILNADSTLRIIDISVLDSLNMYIEFEIDPLFNSGDYIWIKDELFKYDGSYGPGLTGFSFQRAQNGTRKHVYSIDPKIGYLTCSLNGRNSPIGLEFNILENDKIIYKGYIKRLSTVGAGITLNISEITKKIKNRYYGLIDTIFYFIDEVCGFEGIFDWTGVTPYSLTSPPEVDISNRAYLSAEEWLNAHTKSLIGSFIWNKEAEIYKLIKLSEINNFHTVENIKLEEGILFDGGINCSIDSLLMDITLKYSDEKTVSIDSGFLAGHTNNERLEIDCSIVSIPDNDALDIVEKLSSIFSFILGRVDISLISSLEIKIGKYYKVPEEISFFYGNINSIIMQCINISKTQYSFIILNNQPYNPVTPEIKVKSYWDGTNQWLIYNTKEVSDSLKHLYISGQIALVDFEYDCKYFQVGEKVLIGTNQSIIGEYDLLLSPTNLIYEDGRVAIDLGGDPHFADDLNLIITYPLKPVANINQSKFLYNLDGVV